MPHRTLAVPALALAAASGIHLGAAWAHRSVWMPIAIGLLVAGIAQAVAAVAIRRGSLRGPSIVLNLAILGAWGMSRTVGLPVGPLGIEAVTVHDLAAALLALVAIAGLSRPARPASRISASPGRAPVAAGVITAVAFTLVGPAGHEDHVHGHRTSTLLSATAAGRALAADPDIHLHGLGGDPEDLGADPSRTMATPLDATREPVASQPTALAMGQDDALWIAHRSGSVTRVRSGEPSISRTITGTPTAILSAFGRIWIADMDRDLVLVLDPERLQPVARIRVGVGPVALAATSTWVWVTTITDGLLQPIDPATLRAGDGVPVGYGPIAVRAIDAERLVIVNALDREIRFADTRGDRATLSAPIAVDAGPSDVIRAAGSIWVANVSAGTVQRIDPVSRRITDRYLVDEVSQPGLGPAALATDGRRVFVVNNHDRSVRSIDPATGTVSAPRFFGNVRSGAPMDQDAVVSGDRLLLTDFDGAVVASMPTGS